MARRKRVEKIIECVNCHSKCNLNFYVGENKLWGCLNCNILNLTLCCRSFEDPEDIIFWSIRPLAYDIFDFDTDEHLNGIDLNQVRAEMRKGRSAR